jgi:penicillin-insensitive murein endopeptidase
VPAPVPDHFCAGIVLRLALLVGFALVLATPRFARADDQARSSKTTRPTRRRASLVAPEGRSRVGTHETRAAVSVGSPSEGHLENGAHLDTSKYIHVVPAYQRGDVRWGHPVLTHMLERGARAVAKRWPGSVLDVGDLSRKNGGDVLRHHSHESGRDADVAFFVSDAKGRPLHAPHFVRFDAAIRATNFAGAQLDEARTWAFVQAILTDPIAHVSHVFIAEPIRQRLLAYARGHGVSHALWTRAAVTMMQPTDSEAHDDHMHVRISCPSSSHGSCLEIARRAFHRPHLMAQKPPMRPSVLRTPRPALAVVASKDPPLASRSYDHGDDIGPLARARLLP